MLYTYLHLRGLVVILAEGVESFSQIVTAGDYSFQWSYRGPIVGYHCIHIEELAERSNTGWGDNFAGMGEVAMLLILALNGLMQDRCMA